MAKRQRPKKKIVLFLVEGKSEKQALEMWIKRLYDDIDENTEVFFSAIDERNAEGDQTQDGGDITSKRGVNPETIEGVINKLYMKEFFDINKILPRDISEVIHIVDMDGAFAPDEAIKIGDNPSGEDKFYYTENAIIVANENRVHDAIDRNHLKRENISCLVLKNDIRITSETKPYSIYYLSSNLDHVLYDNANLNTGEKVPKALEFSEKLKDTDAFAKEILEHPCAVQDMDYMESWRFIQDGYNSLQRHTNLNILLSRILELHVDDGNGTDDTLANS